MRRHMVKTTAVISLLTVLEKALSAARHIVLAAFFGAGAAMDTLVVGVSVAELLLALLTGSFLSIFIPLYFSWQQREGAASADSRSLNLIVLLTLVLAVAAGGLALWGGTIAGWVGYGFSAEQRAMAGTLMPWLAVFLWGTGAGVLATGLFHVRGRFLAPPMAQIVERLVVMALIVVLAPAMGIRSVAVALGVGALVLVLLLTAGAWRRRTTLPRPELSARAPEVRSYVILFLPLLGASIVDQTVLFTDRAMASSLPSGAVSALYYATALWWIPVVLLCNSFSTVMLPRLSADVAAGEPERLQASIVFGFKTMVLLMVGAMVPVMILGRDATALMFQRGRFDSASTVLTTHVFIALSLCLVIKGLANIINMTMFAAQRTRVVALCGVARVGLNIFFNWLLMGPFGAVGIALSTSLTMAVWLGIVAVPFRRELARLGVGPILDPAFRSLLLKAGLAAALAAGVTLIVAANPLLVGEGTLTRWLRLLLAGGAGMGTYALTLYGLRLPEASEVARLLSARLGRRSLA